jgi:23S rRNA-/tRNA-specific pseudouridylate synthase
VFKTRLHPPKVKQMAMSPPTIKTIVPTDKVINIAGYPSIKIIYEDNDLLILDKPSGMLSVPGNVDGPVVKPPRFEEWRTAIKATYDE